MVELQELKAQYNTDILGREIKFLSITLWRNTFKTQLKILDEWTHFVEVGESIKNIKVDFPNHSLDL